MLSLMPVPNPWGFQGISGSPGRGVCRAASAPSETFDCGRLQPKASAVPGVGLLGAESWISFASSGQLKHLLICGMAAELQEPSPGRVFSIMSTLLGKDPLRVPPN